MGRQIPKDSFAPPGLRSCRMKTPGWRPGLHSVTAPRLFIVAEGTNCPQSRKENSAMKSKKPNRREFLGRSSGLAGAAGVLSASSFEEALGGQAQERAGNAIRRPERFDDSFIFERKPFTWPGGKTLAIWIIPNVEVWQFDSAAGAAISPNASNRGVERNGLRRVSESGRRDEKTSLGIHGPRNHQQPDPGEPSPERRAR